MEVTVRTQTVILIFMIIGSVLIGFGTNWMVGAGVFFLMWALAGLLED